MASAQIADFLIDRKPYMVVRSGDHVGARNWQEQGPGAAEQSESLKEVVRGELPNELRISWETKHKGFGEPIATVAGRDYYGRNVDKRYENQTILARSQSSIDVSAYTAGADPGGFAELGSYLYLSYGRYVLKIDPSTDAVTTALDCNGIAAGVKSKSIASFQDKLFLAVGESNAFRHSTDGTTWTAHSGGLTATFFRAVQNRLYRISKGSSGTTPAHLSNNLVDPTDNLNWSALDPIGDPNVPVTGMANVAYQIFIAKEDGLYAADVDTGRFPSLTPEIAAWRNTSNGQGVFGWGGLCFYPTVRGVKMFFSGQLFPAGPEVMSANDSEVRGRVSSMGGDANWVFGALYNGTDTYILAGRNPRSDDRYPGEILWNTVWYVSGGPYTAMWISGLNSDPRLWLARQGDLRYIKLGNQLDNPLQDSTAVYQSSAVDYYPAHDGGSPMVDKHFLELRVYCENLSRVDGRKITWAYRLDDASAWTTLGTTQDSPVSVLKFDQNVDSIGKRIQLQATWARGSTTTETPILRRVEVLAVENRPNRKLLVVNILAADRPQLRVGQDARKASEIVEDLEDLAAAGQEVKVVDPLGRERDGLPLSPVLIREVMDQDTRNPVLVATAQYLVTA